MHLAIVMSLVRLKYILLQLEDICLWNVILYHQ